MTTALGANRSGENRLQCGTRFPQLRCRHLGRLILALSVGIIAGLSNAATAEVLYWPINGIQVAHDRAESVGCAQHLVSILHAAEVWAIDNLDQAPDGFPAFTNTLGSPALLYCPANARMGRATNWDGLDWGQVDYQWLAPGGWFDPTNVAGICHIHEHKGLWSGEVKMGGYRPGWPHLAAAPMVVTATPGETVRWEARVVGDALPPVTYQWQRDTLNYVTNVVQITNPDDPRGVYWQTNVKPVFTSIPISWATNSTFEQVGVQETDSGLYSLRVTNPKGEVQSLQAPLRVEPGAAGFTTNEAWSEAFCANQLRMLGLIVRVWAEEHLGQMPQDFSSLTNSDGWPLFGWPAALFCRSDTNRPAPANWSGVDFTNTSYTLTGEDPADPYAPFACCRLHGYYVQMDGDVMLRPVVHGVRTPAPGKIEVNLRLFAGRTNVLERSTDLEHWVPAAEWFTTGNTSFTETTDSGQRFFRLRLTRAPQ